MAKDIKIYYEDIKVKIKELMVLVDACNAETGFYPEINIQFFCGYDVDVDKEVITVTETPIITFDKLTYIGKVANIDSAKQKEIDEKIRDDDKKDLKG